MWEASGCGRLGCERFREASGCFIKLQVSWIRHRDIHLLTVGRYTYTSDQRFSAHHVPMTHFWQLRIRGLTHRDAGKYECQVSTTPPRGHQMYLSVVGKLYLQFLVQVV